jgi:hypothetical protein
MKTATIKILLYSISELQEQPKDIAIQEHENFLVSQGMEIENEEGKLENIPYNPTKEEIIESIEINDYLFFKNGDMANCTTFVGNHPRAGKTVLNFRGSEYEI